MPGYKIHLVGGTIAAAVLFYFPPTLFTQQLTLEQKCFYGALALLGALFPDIDIKSKGQKIFSRIILLPICTSIILGKFNFLALFTILALFPLLIKHRGITHNPWFIATFPILIFYISQAYVPIYQQQTLCGVLFFSAGAFSHLILDFGPIKLFTRDKRGF